MEHNSLPPSDSVRYSLKLWRYLQALEAISKALQIIETQGAADKAAFEGILYEILPSLSQAFASEGAFYADIVGKICFAEPENSPLAGKILPPTKHIEQLLKHDMPLVIEKEKDIPPKLNALGVRSLLVVPLDVSWDKYFVGVYNGRDDPAYTGDDKTLLESLMRIVGSGFSYGHTQAEASLAYDRYLHAQRSGRYNFLSRASEDYAKFLMHLRSDTSNAQRNNGFNLDDVLADYLDAELCKVMQDLEYKPARVTTDDATVKKTKLTDHLLSLVEVPKGPSLIVHLRHNKASKQLKPQEYPRTALAVVRIGLWAGYMAGARVPEWLDKGKRRPDSLPEDLCEAEAADLFYTLPHWLLETIEAGKKIEEESPLSDRSRIDWPRTLWQKIHYLARNGITEPRHEWIQEVVSTYAQVRLSTSYILSSYLMKSRDVKYIKKRPNLWGFLRTLGNLFFRNSPSDHVPEEGMWVDSDWLTAWLVSNVLLSKRLAEHYQLEASAEGQEPIASPSEKMRYFAHLSHLVLYVLHCTRHLHREGEVQNKVGHEVTVQRLPFAEVPLDLSLGLSETQLYILSEYAYREIGVHRELVLLERLARQLRYELPLYAASEFYRDHLHHVIDVCLLGELLLRSRVLPCSDDASSPPLVDVLSNCNDCEDSRVFMQNWYIAALCHDLGYVIELAGNLLEPVRTINGPGLDEFWKAVEDGLKHGGSQIKQAVMSKLFYSSDSNITVDDLKKVAPTDHGVAAWLHLNHWLDQVKESPQKLTHALNAILRHNLPKQTVNYYDEPLTLLLMLCDHLQEWGRPRVGPDPLARGVMEALRFSEQTEFEPKIRVKQLAIKGLGIIPADQSDLIAQTCDACLGVGQCKDHCPRFQTQIEPDGLEFELRHLESREADFEPAISWLLWCRDLQCFDYQDKKLPFDIRITLQHTPSRIWHVLPWKPLEMDLIQEFASGYEPAVYLCEWVEKARSGEDGIHYKCKRKEGVETFMIHLNQLRRPLERGLPDEHWRQFFKWKWRRLGQQFIDLSLGAWFPEL